MILDNCHISFINLDHRKDRLDHMTSELDRIGLHASRFPGLLPDQFTDAKYSVMRNRTPGAIGCHMSQVGVMKQALELGKHAFVMEDDIIFCDDFKERIEYISKFTDSSEWDVIWLGASFHAPMPFWHPVGPSKMRPDCSARLGYDVQPTSDPRMVRTFGAYITFAYIVNVNSIQKIFDLFDKHIHESIGIDWLFIKIQPQLKCFSFVPGCIMQRDNISDIGKGMTVWSGQLNNGPYVFKKYMHEFNPEGFKWNQ